MEDRAQSGPWGWFSHNGQTITMIRPGKSTALSLYAARSIKTTSFPYRYATNPENIHHVLTFSPCSFDTTGRVILAVSLFQICMQTWPWYMSSGRQIPMTSRLHGTHEKAPQGFRSVCEHSRGIYKVEAKYRYVAAPQLESHAAFGPAGLQLAQSRMHRQAEHQQRPALRTRDAAACEVR